MKEYYSSVYNQTYYITQYEIWIYEDNLYTKPDFDEFSLVWDCNNMGTIKEKILCYYQQMFNKYEEKN